MGNERLNDIDEMSFGEMLITGLREAVAYERGELTEGVTVTTRTTARKATVAPPPRYEPDQIVRIRRRTGLSQPVFARMLNVSPKTVKSWEQGERQPDGPTLRLLQLAETTPHILEQYVTRHEQTRAPTDTHRGDQTPAVSVGETRPAPRRRSHGQSSKAEG